MRRTGLAAAVAVVIIVLAFALDAWVSIPAYAYALMPGYVVVSYLDRVGAITAFDSSGDLALAGIVVALVVNLLFWSSCAWLVTSLFSRRSGTKSRELSGLP
jgi:hypothetical protein